ncbi:hypothetical protein ACVWW7_002383 [Bradyrhizobium sp. LM6.9]
MVRRIRGARIRVARMSGAICGTFHGCRFAHPDYAVHAFASAGANTTSISEPEFAALLMLNRARLASTRALVSDRLSAELSSASPGGGVRNGSIAAATSRSLRPWPVSRMRRATSPWSDSAVETMTWPPALASRIEFEIRFMVICRIARASTLTCGSAWPSEVRMMMRSRLACGCITTTQASTRSLRLRLAKLRSSLPVSIRDSSSRSSMMAMTRSPEARMSFMYSP